MSPRGSAIVGLSGGVDSAVAALLLQQAGYEVTGVTLQLHACDGTRPEQDRSCCGPASLAAAAAVADQLGIRHYRLSVAAEFATAVLASSWEQYRGGRTPNPCVHCNARVKFERLLAVGRDLGAAVVATGHYARVEASPGGPVLRRGVDAAKDQSYFLFALSPAQLARLEFPLGGLQKTDVRRLAVAAGLANARRPESQDVCFVSAGGSFPDYLSQRFGGAPPEGAFVDAAGQPLGEHGGIHRYTLGQRRGLGLPGGPFWVRALHPDTGQVELTRDRRALLAAGCRAGSMHWLVDPRTVSDAAGVTIQTRYRQTPVPAAVRLTALDGSAVEAVFASPVSAVTPGQALVLYADDRVLGGGWIDAATA